MECNCDMRTKLVADGCSKCNPELHLAVVTERMEEAEAKLDAIDKWCEECPPISSKLLESMHKIRRLIDD